MTTNTPQSIKNRRIHSRRCPKRGTKATCRLGTLDLGPNLVLALLDVSETGVRLLLREPVGAAKEVTVTLEGSHHRRPLRLTGRVAWCLATAEGGHCVGVQFERRLPYAECLKLT
jgi:hypothetical protein